VTSPSYPQRRFAVPPDATELVLVRHGASTAAVRGEPFTLVGGHADPPLSAEGAEQAERVAARLADERIDRLFVTPLRRTSETAAPLAAARGLRPEVVDDLREVNLGAWEGGEFRIRMAERDPVAMQAMREERWDVIPGAEHSEAFAARVARGVAHVIAATGAGGVAVAVLHGGVIGEICRQVTRSRPFAFIHGDNTSITRVVAYASGHRLLRSFNDASHLDGVTAG
jgi:2,3-bisphosphoglycerate-dependent phosphoglycerate mutase